jgi:hypothetical protein
LRDEYTPVKRKTLTLSKARKGKDVRKNSASLEPEIFWTVGKDLTFILKRPIFFVSSKQVTNKYRTSSYLGLRGAYQ